jgi:hypothetical protein
MMFTSNRRVVPMIVAALCIAVTTSASAYSPPSTSKGDAAQSGRTTFSPPSTTKSDAAQSGRTAFSPPSTSRSDAAQSGRTPSAAPATIEVVRPERTIVRDVDQVHPLVLSGIALLLVLGMWIRLIRTGTVPRPGRSH